MTYEQILYATKAPIGYLTLNNPKKINALSKKMIGEIIQVLDEVAVDEAIKVLIIRAAGDHFCAGHDLAEMLDGGVKGGLPRSRTRPRDPSLASLDQTQGEIRRSQLGHALDLVGHRVASQNSWFTLGMTDSLSSVEIEDE